MTRWAGPSWVHPSVEVRGSEIEGRGLFATVGLAAGTVVSRLRGRLVSDEELADLLARSAAGGPYVDTIAVSEGVHLVLAPWQIVHYGNHSCDPTLWHTDAYTLVTRRFVAAGEELTVDYATHTAEESFTMACRCGATVCRGVITGGDWRRPDFRSEYRGHVVPVVAARIAAAEG